MRSLSCKVISLAPLPWFAIYHYARDHKAYLPMIITLFLSYIVENHKRFETVISEPPKFAQSAISRNILNIKRKN